ncbi:hypothetical protein EDB81DRAFT_710112 [Dactylonectria macrodidyma]|uniref:Quinate permease n=1 Tax=Dactylonectria macrodidyma TaxID=307937 RepID=A0A9P9JQ62_9HYPO|nr:hypothetical protein EDB81DRAFT_710112 [Dactylonectria macrodidyma]
MPEQSEVEPSRDVDSNKGPREPRKRPRQPASDAKYPRKRSVRACHVCRARKTKCDNVQPTCGFCASINIPCSFDASEKDHSSFDPASLEILRQLGQIITSQDEVLQAVRSVAVSQPQCAPSDLSPSVSAPTHTRAIGDGSSWDATRDTHTQHTYVTNDGYGQQSDSASTTPAASASVAAVRWFGLLANDASHEASHEADFPLDLDGGFLEPSDGQNAVDLTPLQRATRIIDGQPPTQDLPAEGATHANSITGMAEERLWQASENICLLEREQILFENFIHRICSWLDLFDPARTFSTRVPHLAVRNAGLLNAILALSGFHQSLDGSVGANNRPDQNTTLQYYYQTLHYVQKAMRYPTYQNSRELMATTLIISTYEMLRGSRKDWQKHLQGVFWILRSRQIEVEASSLESTTWWAWLRQDIWVAFREKRRTYSTWSPKKGYADLDSHELASRAVWILAQVINFCALDASEDIEDNLLVRIGWAKALKKMLLEWQSHLTVEFSSLPAMSRHGTEAFQPRLIHPQCFGLAMQIHHVSQILISAHEPCLGGLEAFMRRQKTIQHSIDMVCGIGMTLTEDASSMLSSQCLFIAGMFMQNPRQRSCVLDMLDSCRNRCSWPTPSLSSELEQIWDNPDSPWGSCTPTKEETQSQIATDTPRLRRRPRILNPLHMIYALASYPRNLWLKSRPKLPSAFAPRQPKMTIHGVFRRVIRNDAIRACFAGALFGVDAGIIGGVLVMPDFKREFGLDTRPAKDAADLAGNLVTTMQAGAVAGALISSPFADRKGRKPALLAVAITGFIGGLMQAFSYGHLSVFYIGRFVEGIGLGAGTMLAPTYVAENSPRAIRGFLVGFFQLLLVMGGMTAYFINYGALLHLSPKATWMVPLACQSICPALLFFSMLFCPESPRWLASRDQWDKATSVLSDVRHLPQEHPYIQQELLEMRTQLDQERAIMQGTGFWSLQKECWTIPGNRKRALLTVGLISCQQWTGTGAINYYAPTIFKSLGLSSTTTALFAQGVYGIVKVVTCLIFVFFLADSLGRRLSFMWSGTVQAFCMFFLGFYVRFGPKIGEDQSPPPAGIAALAMVYIFAAAFNMGWGPVSWVFVSEIPTNRLRAYNVALASFTHWVHNLAVSKATPVMLLSDPYRAYFIFGSFNLFMAIVAFWLPETKGISLERMDEIFGVADFSHVEDVGIAARQAQEKNEAAEHEDDARGSKV